MAYRRKVLRILESLCIALGLFRGKAFKTLTARRGGAECAVSFQVIRVYMTPQKIPIEIHWEVDRITKIPRTSSPQKILK